MRAMRRVCVCAMHFKMRTKNADNKEMRLSLARGVRPFGARVKVFGTTVRWLLARARTPLNKTAQCATKQNSNKPAVNRMHDRFIKMII